MMQAAASRKIILLDFDGVVLCSPAADKFIRQRCERFVSCYTGIRNERTIKKLNTFLYKKHGHTVAGLKQMTKKRISLYSFNEAIYDNIDYCELRANMKRNEFNVKLLENAQRDYDDVYIFSNARSDWVYNICSSFGHKLDARVLDVSDYFLKPDKSAYKLVETMVEPYKSLVYIDDSAVNINAAPEHWTKLHYTPKG